MISQRRKAGDDFERRLHAIGLQRIRIRWRNWVARKGDPKGEIVCSPQWPAPFGPPIVRAVGSGGEVVIKPANEQTRKRWLASLDALAAWSGQLQNDAFHNGNWVKVPEARVTTGCYVVYEHIEGKDVPIYYLAANDAGPVELTDHVARVIKSSQGAIDDFQHAQSIRTKEAEITYGFGSKLRKTVRRTPEQQEWRAVAEDKIADLEAYRFHRRFSAYQHDPSQEETGERHPAGFIIKDRRVMPQSGLADKP